MAGEAIRIKGVEGLEDLRRALKRADTDASKGLDKELRETAKIVSDDARSRLAVFSDYSARGIRPRLRGFAHVLAEQSRRKTTGQHPEWGDLVMKKALLPALAKNEDVVVARIEAALARVEREFEHGF